MTKAARVVLQDAKHAIGNHTDDLQSEGFRVSWFATVGLLRAVGHVLDKVDSETSLEMKKAIKEKWAQLQSTRPEPKIFWSFIDVERNRFLKNYEHGISRTLTIPVEPNSIAPNGSLLMIDCANSRGGGSYSQGIKLKSFISGGPYAGQNEKEIAWEAYDWWVAYLDEVDKVAANYSSA